MKKEERYRLWLNFAVKADYNAQTKLLNLFGTAEDVFQNAKETEIKKLLGEKSAKKIEECANEAYIDNCLRYLEKNKIKTAVVGFENYPFLLSNIDDPPYVLYYRGTLKSHIEFPLAVIGSRRCNEYTKKVAEDFSKRLCENGACIVSGMAYGIDAVAAKGALSTKSDYPTIAVLAGGVDHIYPMENEHLYYEIIERGAVVAEWLPATHPEKWHFPFRNRIMSGMSKGVLVAGAGEKSGTSTTVGRALEQGRDVFVVPGRIDDYHCKGSNAMIRDGYAKPVFDIDDILSEYGMHIRTEKKPIRKVQEKDFEFEELLIIKLLQSNERSIDELAIMTKYDVLKLNSVLTDLEFSGIIKQLPGRLYQINHDIEFNDFIDDERQW